MVFVHQLACVEVGKNCGLYVGHFQLVIIVEHHDTKSTATCEEINQQQGSVGKIVLQPSNII